MKRYFFCIMAVLSAFAVLNSCSKYSDGYYDDRYYETNTSFLTLRNYSSDTTVWFIPDAGNGENLPLELSEWQKIEIYEIKPQSAISITFDSNDNYVTPVETYGIEDNMVIYVFKKDVWDKFDWAEIVAGRMWCGRCSLSLEDARKTHGIVTYPMR